MAISSKYGRINISKIGNDEPIFILRAQDKLAESAIGMYQILATSYGSQLSVSLDKEIKAFQAWQGPKKLPD
jgi:hypothetical protein